MSTKYLRKIILEELEEVLKEVVVPAGISIGKKTKKDYLKSLIPGESQKIFYPTLQNTQRNAKKVLSAINGRSIIAGYKPCGNEMYGLKKGCMGKGVLKLQSFLKSAHDNMSAATVQTTEPEIDGYFGPKTEASLNSFLKMANEPNFFGVTTKDMLDVTIGAAVPDNFDQRYEAAYQQLKNDLEIQDTEKATPGPDDKLKIRKKLAKTTPAGAFVDPETGKDKKIFTDEDPVIIPKRLKKESLIRREIIKALREL